jgi:hypothetical protein
VTAANPICPEGVAILKVAEAIAGDNLPWWLIVGLAAGKRSLEHSIRRKASYPAHGELHKRLKAIEKATNLLLQELPDPVLFALLRYADQPVEIGGSFHEILRNIVANAAASLERSPRGWGNRRFYSEWAAALASPREYCALVVCVAWEKTHGAWPGESNQSARQACEVLWRAAGGVSAMVVPHPNNAGAWRRHIREARELANSSEATPVRRMFSPQKSSRKARKGDVYPSPKSCYRYMTPSQR